jgi:hypothetical protein
MGWTDILEIFLSLTSLSRQEEWGMFLEEGRGVAFWEVVPSIHYSFHSHFLGSPLPSVMS